MAPTFQTIARGSPLACLFTLFNLALSTPCGLCARCAIQVAAVREPEPYAMMLTGLAPMRVTTPSDNPLLNFSQRR